MNDQCFALPQALTMETVQAEIERLMKWLREDSNGVTLRLDLSNVTQCDSAGLALLIEAKRLCHAKKKFLAIQGMPEAIQALATFCGVESLFTEHTV